MNNIIIKLLIYFHKLGKAKSLLYRFRKTILFINNFTFIYYYIIFIELMDNISEKDLYKFTFYPLSLSEERRIYIENNFEKFEDDLNILKSIQKDLAKNVSDNLLDRIYKKIDSQAHSSQIVLDFVKPNDDDDRITFAADSQQPDSKPLVSTFIDNANNILGKIITKDKKHFIYIFSKTQPKSSNFDLILHPSKEIYSTNFEDLPLIISPEQIISSISLRFS